MRSQPPDRELIRRQRSCSAIQSEPGHVLFARTLRLRETFIHTPQQVGKYLVSPLTRLHDSGRYAALVSIRSGRGSSTHDRVVRFEPLFESSDQAARYALAYGLAWTGLQFQPTALQE